MADDLHKVSVQIVRAIVSLKNFREGLGYLKTVLVAKHIGSIYAYRRHNDHHNKKGGQ